MSAENIKITEKAKDYLKKKGKLQVVIEFPEHRLNSESVVVPIPEIFAKKPKKPESFQKTAIDGIDIYISNSVILPSNDVVIDLDSFLGIKILSLSGFKASE
jgi:hypothetical protein